MSNYHCYLCASDEGILLDIFGVDGQTICGMIETCLSVKIQKSNAPSTKICHKCAYELDACSKFVEKYRQARDGTKAKSNPIKGYCSLCSEPGQKGYIFDCRDGNPVNDSLHKIHEIFNDDIFRDKRRNFSICLDCRYNLDVLFDLKCIYQSTPDKLRSLNEKGLQLSELPKTRTRVVIRKTTYIPLPRLNGAEVCDTDSTSTTSIMPLKRKGGRPSKKSTSVASSMFRTCRQCDTCVENGLDMYRYHRTGLTVCKECWLSMDLEKVSHNKRKKLGLASGEVGTRRCSIILKDVLSNPSKYENIYKVEKDEHGNTTFIITDDSSENEEREKTPVRKSRRNLESVTSVDSTSAKKTKSAKRTASTTATDLDDEPPVKVKVKGTKIDDDEPPMKVKVKGTKIDDDEPLVKVKVKGTKIDDDKPSTSKNTRSKNGLAISDTEVFVSKTRRKFIEESADSEKTVKAASDAELTKPPAKKRGRPLKYAKSEPADSSSNEKKTAGTMRGRKAAKTVAPVVSTSHQIELPARRTRANSFSSQDVISLSNRLSTLSRNAKSVSEAESPSSKTKRSKTKSLSPKNSNSELELEKPYICSVCHSEYKNKLIGMKHELTHAKQPEVKLQRVAIPEIIVEEAPAESLIEEPEEQSHDVSSTSDHRSEDPESVETSTTAVPHEVASIDVLAEANENKENLEDGKRLPEADAASAKVDDKKDEEVVNNDEEIEEDKIEDKVDVPEATQLATTVENNAENTREDETKDTLAIAESDKNNDVKETEITTGEALDSENPESTPSEEVAKEVESAEPPEKPSEEILHESTEMSSNVKRVTVENNAESEVNEANEMEKEAVVLDSDTEPKTIDVCTPEESIEPESVPSVTSTAPEKEIEDKDVVKNKQSPDDEETTNDLEGEVKAATTEAPIVQKNDTTKRSEESESIVSDVLAEVFNLATAEVQKRLENENPRDEKCTTPVSETLENISREICNSADMPSLEPLVDDQSSNNQS